MDKDEVIDELWGRSNHGTRREDVEFAYNAGVAAERERCKNIVCYWLTGYAPSAGTYEARCVAQILEGRPSSAWHERPNATYTSTPEVYVT